MKKKGFTLVELLAVIAILAILVIIALPNIMSLFNQSKQNSFENEVKQIFKTAQQEWMKDSMFDTQNIVYARCSEKCSKELQLSGRTNINYYIEVDKGGNIIRLFATDNTYQYKYKGKGLKIEEIGGSKQIAKLSSSEVIKITCNKIEQNGKDITNTQEKVLVTPRIYWALQDNDGDSINETLVISDSSVSGNRSGSFNGNTKLYPDYNVPWINTGSVQSDSNLSYNVTTVKIEGEVAPISTSDWFKGVGYNSSIFNADLSNLNVSNVTDMSGMFYDTGHKATNWSITGLSNWDTSNVTSMENMFSWSGFTSETFAFDLSSWNTSKVTNMVGAFNIAGYNATTFNLDLSNWDTSNVTDMSAMFVSAGEYSPTFNLNLSNWNTLKAAKMENMFKYTGRKATIWKIIIPKTNGNGTSNTTSRMYGKDASVYSSANKLFTLAS